MSIATGKPPYDEVEVERIAKALCVGDAFGSWLNSNEANRVFFESIKKLGPRGLLRDLEAGAIFVFQFFTPALHWRKGALPHFDSGWKWLDAANSRLVLQREHALAKFAGGAAEIPKPRGQEWMSDEAAIDHWVDHFERLRVETLPEVRRRIAAGPGLPKS